MNAARHTAEATNYKRHALAAAIGFALASTSVQADTFQVTSTADSGAGTLRDAITSANAAAGPHTIDFSGVSGQTITLEGDLPVIEEDLSLQGSDVTLSGDESHRCLIADEASLEVNDMTVTGCADYIGGVGAAYGDVVVNDSTITGNQGTYGGGVGVYAGNVAISGSTITGNTGDLGGGVLGYAGSLTIDNSTISGNTASVGGGVAAYEAINVSITGSTTISGNEADAAGGGVSVKYAETLTIEDSTITGNNARDGGGLFAYVLESLVDSTIISNNTASDEAGGAFVFGNLALVESEISGNEAEIAGGVFHFGYYADYGNLAIIQSSISNNTATKYEDLGVAGLFQLSAEGETTIVGSSISDNQSSDGDVGGWFAALDEASLTVEQSTISGNQAAGVGGGAIIGAKYSSLHFENNTVSGNTAAVMAGLSLEGTPDGETVLTGQTITANTASDGPGGGLLASFNEEHTLAISNSIISGNSAAAGSGDLSASDELQEPAPRASNESLLERIRERLQERGFSGERFSSSGTRDTRNPDNTTFEVSFSLIGEEPESGNFLPDTTTEDLIGVDPELGGLADNGGPTLTHMPVAGSPAVNLIPQGQSDCGGGFNVDQRGEPRPGGGTTACDAGSVERQAPVAPEEPIQVPVFNRIGLIIGGGLLMLLGLFGLRRRV